MEIKNDLLRKSQTTSAHLRLLREGQNLSRPKWARVLDVSVATVLRAETENSPIFESDYIFRRIAELYPQAVSFLVGETDVAPKLVPRQKAAGTNDDGQKLKMYLRRREITQVDMSKLINRTQAQTNHYLNSNQIRADIKKMIADALRVKVVEIWPK